jgi:hypothetical protein
VSLISKFLNSPFGLWLLSSVVLAGFLTIASEEQRCYSTAIPAVPKLVKTASERDLRILEILTVIHNDKSQSSIEAEITGIISGSRYFYGDYKGKSMLDLELDLVQSVLEMNQIGQKEHPDVTTFSFKGKEVVMKWALVPIDQKTVDKLRDDSLPWFKENGSSEIESLLTFPFLLKDTKEKFHTVFEQTPCQPFYLVKDRIKQYLFGLW